MVQMKRGLYFRLKNPGILLYIPHGSDETILKNSFPSIILTFISHMVQMKQKNGSSTGTPEIILYIPHGSDETKRLGSIIRIVSIKGLFG